MFPVIVIALHLCACSGNLPQGDAASVVTPFVDAGPNPNAYWEDDPPPKYCGPDGGTAPAPPPAPGGTAECPDDKNREGCSCRQQGTSAPCWPGLRVHRNRGICKDGTTTCQLLGELNLRWGPCEGYVLPKPGVELGAEGCACFSEGKWQLDNLTHCLLTYPNGEVWAVASYLENGTAKCPKAELDKPPTPAGVPWTASTLTVDCAGQFKLCYTIKAGDFNSPEPSDCVVASTCTEVWYMQENVPQALSPLPSWLSADTLCAGDFKERGGYGEMTVEGLSIQCEPVDDKNGGPRVFKRVSYCALACDQNPALPQCQGCGYDGDGTF